jgi:hypothetical protein
MSSRDGSVTLTDVTFSDWDDALAIMRGSQSSDLVT